MPPTVRKRPRQERARATVEAILSATAKLLVREGFASISTNRVAELAGVSIGSLYQYFPSKEALVAALLDRHMDEAQALIRARIAELAAAPLEVAVRELVELMVDLHRQDPKLHRALMEQLPRGGGFDRLEEIEHGVSGLVELYLEARKDEIRPRDLRVAAFLIVQAVESATHSAVIFRQDLLAGRAFVDELVEMVMRYLAPAPRKRR